MPTLNPQNDNSTMQKVAILKQELARRKAMEAQGQQQRMGGALQDIGGLFLQQGGQTPPARTKASGDSSLDELVKLQKAELEAKLTQSKIDKMQAEIEAKRGEATQAAKTKEAEDALRGGKTGSSTSIPTNIIEPTKETIPEILPTDTVSTPTQDAVQPSIPTQIGGLVETQRTEKVGDITRTFKDLEREKREKMLEEEVKITGKRKEEASKALLNFDKTVNLFSGIIAQVKGSEEEQGGLGLIPGLKGAWNVAIKNPDFSRTASAYGQRAETAFAMNSVLTGQNRVIKGVINMILQSLPDKLDPDTTVASKTSQSLKNAFMLSRAFKQAGLSAEVLEKLDQNELDNINVQALVTGTKLTEAEESFLEATIDSVLATPAAKKRTLLNSQAVTQDDFATLSDEELQNIIAGGK